MRRLAALLAVVFVVACDESPTSPSDLAGETWRLVSIERTLAAPIGVPDPNRYTLQFQDGERLSVRADCNTCGGSYTLTRGALSIGPLACTRAFCGNASLDGELLDGLASAKALARDGGELTIRSDGFVLRFRN